MLAIFGIGPAELLILLAMAVVVPIVILVALRWGTGRDIMPGAYSRWCPNCGAQFPLDYSYCGYCGSPLSPSPPSGGPSSGSGPPASDAGPPPKP